MVEHGAKPFVQLGHGIRAGIRAMTPTGQTFGLILEPLLSVAGKIDRDAQETLLGKLIAAAAIERIAERSLFLDDAEEAEARERDLAVTT